MIDRSPLDLARVRDEAGPRWARIRVLDEATSTNGVLVAAADALPDRSALAAEVQTAGRGRLARTWTSPRGAGLTFSALLRPDVPLEHWGWLPLLAGVALATTVRDVAGVPQARLKWPNDLLVDDRKVAGILVQTAGAAAVVGVGLNVSLNRAELPVPTATSLQLCDATGTLDRSVLLGAFLRRLDDQVTRWAAHDGDAVACGLAADYRSACGTLGTAVRVTVSSGPPVEGTATDVDEFGRIRIDTAAGPVTLSAGDVEHLRPR